MIINNPPVFDQIVDTNGIQLKPTRRLMGDGLYEVTWNVPKNLYRSIIPIGSWNMVSTTNVLVSTGLNTSLFNVVEAELWIIPDSQSLSWFLSTAGSNSATGSIDIWFNLSNSSNIAIFRRTGSIFDSTSFDDPVPNRGFVLFTYRDV
jgi:hypothetical protein